jgi:hypothetical protein
MTKQCACFVCLLKGDYLIASVATALIEGRKCDYNNSFYGKYVAHTPWALLDQCHQYADDNKGDDIDCNNSLDVFKDKTF